MMRSRVFIRREGVRKRRRVQRETATIHGRNSRGRGPHPCRMPPTTTRSTAILPPDRVLLLIMSKTTTMTKRGAWWKYLICGYAQWDTWRPYPNQ